MRTRDIAEQFHLSNETLRMDLVEMEKQKRIIRNHGHVQSLTNLKELPLKLREKDKELIAKKVGIRAMQMVQDHQTFFIDSVAFWCTRIGHETRHYGCDR